MSLSTTNDLQSAVQTASDDLADALAAGRDSTDARQALKEARAALDRHQDAKQAAERERKATEAAEANRTASLAVTRATSAVAAVIERVQLSEGVSAPSPTDHPAVASAAAEKARLELEIQRGEPARQTTRGEVAALTKRADAKRVEAAAIRSRRLAGVEEADDAARLYLLDADVADLHVLMQAAQQRLLALELPVVDLRKRLDDAEARLNSARIDAALHGQADRVRVLEQALVVAVRELRSNAAQVNRNNLPTYFAPTQGLRDVANGIAPR